MKNLVIKIGKLHSKLFGYVSKKAKNSKAWAIFLTILVIYEIVEHIVYPILVPYLIYLQWWKN
jgi:hypothetical protein|tara:strand:+ start:1103 stop:1291 length:189 start_codon:yes stop_codon:yes gene_type:complete